MNQKPPNQRILLVEDDAPPLASMVADFLSPHGFYVAIEGRGDTAARRIITENPDAVILDVKLPGLDGFSVCDAVRPKYRGVILVLTARGDESDEVAALEAGADDYMAKPVRPRALLARLKVHLRKVTPTEQRARRKPIRAGSLVVDASRTSAELDGVELDLASADFELLHFLAKNAGRPVSRDDIFQHIHGKEYDGMERSIDLRISRLRKILGDDAAQPDRIKSIRGVGYFLAYEP